MPPIKKQNPKIRDKRIQDGIKVLKYLMNKDNLRKLATGSLESPQKLVVFYAGYIAMRRIWEAKTDKGKKKTGNEELDAPKSDPKSFIYRIEMEIAHPLGYETRSLLKIANFEYWGKKILKMCEE